MNVASAKTHISNIERICSEIEKFDKNNENDILERGFLVDVVGYLCDYKRILEQAINRAELDL